MAKNKSFLPILPLYKSPITYDRPDTPLNTSQALKSLPFYKSRTDPPTQKRCPPVNIRLLTALPFYKSCTDPPTQKRRPPVNIRLLTALPFYEASIDYGERKARPLDNAELLDELLFYRSLNKKLIKSNFRVYAKSYAIEKRYDDPLSQLRASKSTIKELFRELLMVLNT